MYYKIKNRVLFRQYKEYGYITDNSMFGYRTPDDAHFYPGEEYVSESGAIMLGVLSKTPQHIDTIVNKLITIFIDIDFDELKHDTIEFFDMFVDAGFLSRGTSYENCCDYYNNCTRISQSSVLSSFFDATTECSTRTLSQNDFLRSLHIEVANECNERCVHCYIPHKFKTTTIDPALFCRVVEEGRNMNIINVTLSGGEPLLHKNFVDFLAKCRELDLSVNVLTNLTLLSNNIINEMKKNPLLCVQTSIYSMNPLIHDSITSFKGSLQKTKVNLLKLKEAGVPLQISCPVMKQNKDTFNDVIAFGEKNNIAVAVDYVIFGSYDHSNCNLVNRLSLEEIEHAFDKRTSREYIDYLQKDASEKYKLSDQDPICSICRYYICVSAEGFVFPCIGWQSKVVGDLNNKTLKEIWETSDVIKKLRQIKRHNFPKCVKCKDRGYCNVCMMSNSNENSDADPFRINEYHCNVAALIHKKVDLYFNKIRT